MLDSKPTFLDCITIARNQTLLQSPPTKRAANLTEQIWIYRNRNRKPETEQVEDSREEANQRGEEGDSGVGIHLRGRGGEAEVGGYGERLRHSPQPLGRLLHARHGGSSALGSRAPPPCASPFGAGFAFAFASPAGERFGHAM